MTPTPCTVEGCENDARERRKLCHTCEARKKRAKNPIMYAYTALRTNAKRRGKVFTITFDYFRELALKSGYIEGKGKTSQCLSIDRIKAYKGYEEGNLQVITISENIQKYHNEDKHAEYPF